MDFYDFLGSSAMVLLFIATLPSLIKCIRRKASNPFSTLTSVLLLIAATLWAFYGIQLSSPSLVVTGCVYFIAFAILLMQELRS